MKVLGEGLIEKIFSSIGDESKRWADLYKRAVLKGDTSTEFQILRELANRKYGKPKEHVEQEVKLQMSTDEADRIIREHFGQLASLPVLDIKPVNVPERFEAEEQRQNGAKREFEQRSPPRVKEKPQSAPESPQQPDKSPDQQFIDELCGPGSSRPSGALPTRRGKNDFMM